jgi:hypothetical protein
MSQFIYLETAVTSPNIQVEIKKRLILVMLATIQSRTFCLLACYRKKIKIGIYKTIILPVVLYGCDAWSLTLREEDRLRVAENRILRRIFLPKCDEITEGWENCTPLWSD